MRFIPAMFITLVALILTSSPARAEQLDCTATPVGAPLHVVELVSPEPGTLAGCGAELLGSVVLTQGQGHDIYVIVDSSGSTAGTSGLDLDGDGTVGVGDWQSNTDPGDSVLLAELEAVRRALLAWDGADVRVALLEYSAVIPIPPGLPSEQGRIRTVTGLTADLGAVRTGLDVVAAAGSVGATDYGGALLELAAEFDRSSDPYRRPVAFLLSDGKPTFPRLPYDSTETPDVDWALAGATTVATRGVPVHALEVGVFDDIGVLADVASITGGQVLPQLVGEQLLDALLSVNLDGFRNAHVVNSSSGDEASATLLPFGGFRATLGLNDGLNALLFSADLVTPAGTWEIACPLIVNASCIAGSDSCTYTQGYWKTHNRYERNRNQQIPWPLDEDTLLCGRTWLDIFDEVPNGDAWVILAHQWIAATLNVANQAAVPSDVADALALGETLLSACSIDAADRASALAAAGLLDSYNNGVIGPGHCGDNGSSDPPDGGPQLDPPNNGGGASYPNGPRGPRDRSGHGPPPGAGNPHAALPGDPGRRELNPGLRR